jgi:hypothetical protein
MALHSPKGFRIGLFAVALFLSLLAALPSSYATFQQTADTRVDSGWTSYIYSADFVAAAAETVSAIGIEVGTPAGHVNLAIYTDSGGAPSSLLGQTGSTAVSISGWNDIPLSSSISLTSGVRYWLTFQTDTNSLTIHSGYGASGQNGYVKAMSYGSYASSFGSGSASPWPPTMRTTYTSGPPPSDFTITASPSSQSIGAGGTASSTLTVTYGGGFSGTVSLSVTSGCPAGVTCTVFPTSTTASGTATLSVPTLITTSGTFPVIVTATSGPLTHTATFTVTVTPSSTYNFNVHTGATQVVVTVSWTGSGTASVTIAGPSGSPTLSESGAVVYDRTTYQSGSSTPTNIHRVTFTISSPPTGAWTAYVSQSGATVTIEVS